MCNLELATSMLTQQEVFLIYVILIFIYQQVLTFRMLDTMGG